MISRLLAVLPFISTLEDADSNRSSDIDCAGVFVSLKDLLTGGFRQVNDRMAFLRESPMVFPLFIPISHGLAVDVPSAGDIADAIFNALEESLGDLIETGFDFVADVVVDVVEEIAGPALDLMLFVPTPEPVGVYFREPSNAPWGEIFDYMWAGTIPLGFALLIVAWQVGQAGSSLGVINTRKTRKLDRGLFAGLFIIPITYVLAAIFLQLVNAITFYIAPTPDEIANTVEGLLEFDDLIGDSTFWILAWGMASTLLALALLAVLINILRIVILFMLTVLLPVLAALKLAGVPYFQKWADRLINMYVSLGLSSILMATGFRLTQILLGGGSIDISGIPASDFIVPIFAMVPFVIGIIIPAGAISNSLNVMQAASLASAAGGAATKAASRTKKLASAGKKAGSKAGGSKLKSKAKSRAKEEWSTKRRIDEGVTDELSDDVNVDSSSADDPSSLRSDEGVSDLPDNVDDDSDLPRSAGGYRAGEADFAGSIFGRSSTEEETVKDRQMQEGDGKSAGQAVAESFENRSDGEDDDSTIGGAAVASSQETAGQTEEAQWSAVGADKVSEDSSGEGASQGSTVGESLEKESSSGSDTPGRGSASASYGSPSESTSSVNTDSSTSSGSTQTTVQRLSTRPGSTPSGEEISLDRVQYREDAQDLGMGKPESEMTETYGEGGYLQDRNGNTVPIEIGEEGPDLEHGKVYDLEGAEIQEHYDSGDPDTMPDAVANDTLSERGKITPQADSEGRFLSVSVTENTEVEEKRGQTYRSNFASRVNERRPKAKNAVRKTAETGKDAVSTAKNPSEIDKESAKRVAKGPLWAGKTTADKAKGVKKSAVEKLDEALLTEEARDDLGKLPNESSSGSRVHAEMGSRIATGRVADTWEDEQSGTEMAAVKFDRQEETQVMRKEDLSLSVSSPYGKTTSEED